MFGCKSAARSALVLVGLCASANAAEQQAAQPAASIELLTSDSKVSADGSVVQTVHSELRALNDAGALQISRINVPFVAGLQTLEIIEAYTLKADGTKIPVDVSTVVEQLPADAAQSGMVTDQRIKVLFLPQFGAGDTAVYTIRQTTLKPRFPNEFVTGEIFPRAASFKEVRDDHRAEDHGAARRKPRHRI